MDFFGHFPSRKRKGAQGDDEEIREFSEHQQVVMEPFDFKNARFLRYLSTLSPALQASDSKMVLEVLANRLRFLYRQHQLQLPTLGAEVDFLQQNLTDARNEVLFRLENHDAIVLSTFALINNARFIPSECIQSIQTFYTYPVKSKKLPTLEVRLEAHATGVYLDLRQVVAGAQVGAGVPGVIRRLDIPKGTADVQCAAMLRKLFTIIDEDYRYQTHKQRHILGALRATAGNLADCVLVPRAFAELKESKSLRVIPQLAAIIEEYATPCVFNKRQVKKMKTRKPVCKVLSNTLYYDQLVAKEKKQVRKKLRVGE